MRLSPSLRSCVVVLALAVPASAQDADDPPRDLSSLAGIIGVLSMPDVIPPECERVPPAERRLFATPGNSTPVGTLHAQQTGLSSPPDCPIYTTRARLDDGRIEDVVVDELGESERAAVVIDRRGAWFRLRLAHGASWVRATAVDRFTPHAALMQDSIGFLTSAWDGRFHATPGGRVAQARTRYDRDDVRVLRTAVVRGRLWLQVGTDLVWAAEDADQGPPSVVIGWIPARDAREVPTYWFYADPC